MPQQGQHLLFLPGSECRSSAFQNRFYSRPGLARSGQHYHCFPLPSISPAFVVRQAHRHSVLDSQFKYFSTLFVLAFKKDAFTYGILCLIRINRMPTVGAPDFFRFYLFNLNHLHIKRTSSVPVPPSAGRSLRLSCVRLS